MSLQPQSIWKAAPSLSSVPENTARRGDSAQTSAPSNPSAAISPSSASVSSADLLLPHGIGGIFDLAFDLYRAHFRTFSTQVAVLLLPAHAVLYLLFSCWVKPLDNFTDAHPEDATAAFSLLCGGLFTGVPQYGIPGMLSLLVLAIASAPVAIALADIYQGRAPSWADSYRRAFQRIPRVIVGWGVAGLALAAIITITAVIETVMFVLIAGGLSNFIKYIPPVIGTIIGTVAFLLPYLLAMMVIAFYFVFTTPLILLEDVPITSIPARCWQLVGRPRALRTWLAMVFLPIVFFTVQAFMLVSFSSLLSLVSLPSLLQFLLESSLTVLLITFLQPYLLIFLNVLYFDFRIQRDGLDVRLLAADFAPLVYPAPYVGQNFPPVMNNAFPPTLPAPVNTAYAPPAPMHAPAAPQWPQPTPGRVPEPPAAPVSNAPSPSGNAVVPQMDFSTPLPPNSPPGDNS